MAVKDPETIIREFLASWPERSVTTTCRSSR